MLLAIFHPSSPWESMLARTAYSHLFPVLSLGWLWELPYLRSAIVALTNRIGNYLTWSMQTMLCCWLGIQIYGFLGLFNSVCTFGMFLPAGGKILFQDRTALKPTVFLSGKKRMMLVVLVIWLAVSHLLVARRMKWLHTCERLDLKSPIWGIYGISMTSGYHFCACPYDDYHVSRCYPKQVMVER